MECTHVYKTKAGALDPTSSYRKQRDFISFLWISFYLEYFRCFANCGEVFSNYIHEQQQMNIVGPLCGPGHHSQPFTDLARSAKRDIFDLHWPGLQNKVGFFWGFFCLTGLPGFRSPFLSEVFPGHSSQIRPLAHFCPFYQHLILVAS